MAGVCAGEESPELDEELDGEQDLDVPEVHDVAVETQPPPPPAPVAAAVPPPAAAVAHEDPTSPTFEGLFPHPSSLRHN